MIAVDPIWQLALLLIAHWIGDFVFQTTWMATTKNHRLDALLVHVLTYSLILAGPAVLLFGQTETAALFVGANAVLHLATDFVTSKFSSAMYAEKNMRGFFVLLGFDQLLHHLALAATLVWFMHG
ncbi:MAG: hypothetical protein ACI89J_004699 [Hyphomicrobiaceae bacterium]|jgi:hypothetical protein